jgi:hypothetical protein
MSPAKPTVKPRKPGEKPPVDQAAADAFESRLAGLENGVAGNKSTSSPVAQSTGEPRRGIVQRARKGELDRITAYLPLELGEQVRLYCAGHRVEMSAVIADALREWLTRHG